MEELAPTARPRAVGSLVASRTVYAYNWYLVGPIQAAIAAGLGVAFAQVSVALWAFLVGVGASQLPAGLASLRWGARTVSLVGVATMSVGAMASALVPHGDFVLFAAARCGVGVGAGLFFSPAIGLIARYYRTGGKGFGIGLFNGAFSAGAGVAVVLTVVLSSDVGWREALFLPGLVMGAATLENVLVLPRLPEPPIPFSTGVRRAREVLASRYLWLLALGLSGFWATNFAVAQYLVPWAQQEAGMSATAAGTLDMVLILMPLLGAPLGGSLAERGGAPTRTLAFCAGLTGLSIALLPFVPHLSSLLLWPLAFAGGTVSGMASGVLYYLGTLDPRGRGENVPLAIGLINAVQVTFGAFLVLGLGYELFGSESTLGYATGWVLFGAITVGLLPLLLGLGRPGGPAARSKDEGREDGDELLKPESSVAGEGVAAPDGPP